MPIREYECCACGHVMEVLRLSGGNEGPPGKCEKCGTWAGMNLKWSVPGGFDLDTPGTHRHDYGSEYGGDR